MNRSNSLIALLVGCAFQNILAAQTLKSITVDGTGTSPKLEYGALVRVRLLATTGVTC
jgi:hypothetical protein